MLINSNTILLGPRINLLPYKKEHVAKYHDWMQSEELLEKTASERLTLEEEYEMQKTWSQDSDKWLKINSENLKENKIKGKIIGDVNLFMNDSDDKKSAEIEIMIAEPSYRSKGLGKEAVLMMINYAVKHLAIDRFTCKISESNFESLKLFKEKLAFRTVSHSQVFEEYTLELFLTDTIDVEENLKKLKSELDGLSSKTLCCDFDRFIIEYI